MKEILKSIVNYFSTHQIKGEQRTDMIHFMLEKWHNEYNSNRMNKELIIKNRIDAITIALPNGKVGEEYTQLIRINDKEIESYWLEGLEESGLSAHFEIVLDKEEPCISLETKSVIEVSTQKASNCTTNEDDERDDSTEDLIEENFNSERTTEEEVEILEGEKLVYGTPTCGIVVKGFPITAETFDVVLKYKYVGWFEGCSILERKFKITINPDPRTLWKDIPTDENIMFFKEDAVAEYLKVVENEKGTQKDIVAASKRGRSHAHEGKPRDDHFGLYYNDESNWYVIAVSDGAGSAKYSRKGSEVACKVAMEYCKQKLEDYTPFETAITKLNNAEDSGSNREVSELIYEIVGGAAHKAHRAVVEMAKANEHQVKDYSTTLLLTICKKFDFGWFVASFWVGDGAMCIYDKERQYIKLLGTPDGGEYAGQTRFLTMTEIFTPESIMSRLRYSIEKDFTALLLMTDGISDPFFETDANLNRIEKWNELWQNINKEVELKDDFEDSKDQLLNWLDFWSPGNHDDRTLAILY
ncbi:MAG: PP2C family serine/threonine-protein phosphatase [Phocaeicola sp.]